ncbi:hypothetical protein P3K66_20735 [Bacillus cytotoxicus]|uniref:SAM domain-containing protein n=1 Tax=Bacillus cytotoxicus TaxID=580165 RepID=A0AAX2CC51_9BACI|nr:MULTISPECIES: hypothetical protein [Bacillus cereus group]SCL82244.1 Uncharacterized protein BCB44BAC_00172 [Bacillus cytotoxicus]
MKWGIEAIKNYELNCNDLDLYTFLEEEYQSTNWGYLSLSHLQNFLETSGLDRDMILELLPINFKGIA